MLILGRKAGEVILIDGGIRVVVLATDGRTVRLGIDAPGDVRIVRAEIAESVESETRRASVDRTHIPAAAAPTRLAPVSAALRAP